MGALLGRNCMKEMNKIFICHVLIDSPQAISASCKKRRDVFQDVHGVSKMSFS